MERLIRVQRSLATGVLRAINKSDSPSISLYMWIGMPIGWLCLLALMNCLTLGGAHAEVGADGAAQGATVELVAGSSKANSRALITERVPLVEKSPLRSSCSCPLSNRNYLGTATVIIDRESMNLSIESVAESSVKDKGCTPPVRLSAHLISSALEFDFEGVIQLGANGKYSGRLVNSASTKNILSALNINGLVPAPIEPCLKTPYCSAKWQQIGPGGGGRIHSPAISPHDSDLLLAASDMDNVYRSTTAGRQWRMLPTSKIKGIIPNTYRYSRKDAANKIIDGENNYFESRFAFHPTKEGLVFAGTKTSMMRSQDSGLNWETVRGDWDKGVANPRARHTGASLIGFSSDSPDFGLAAFNHFRGGITPALFQTSNRGSSWTRITGFPSRCERVVGFAFDLSPSARSYIVGCSSGLYKSSQPANGKADFQLIGDGLPLWDKNSGTSVKDITSSKGPNGTYVYVLPACNLPSLNPHCTSPLYISGDLGKSWQASGVEGLLPLHSKGDLYPEFLQIGVSRNDPEKIYLTMKGLFHSQKDSLANIEKGNYSTIYRSDNRGGSWQRIMQKHPGMNGDTANEKYNFNRSWRSDGLWGWHQPPEGISVSETNPDIVFLGDAITYSGGKKWYVTDAVPYRDQENRLLQQKEARGGGMPVMGSWRLQYAPWNREFQMLSMTDFANWRTHDNGKTWLYSYSLMNNNYSIGFDEGNRTAIAVGGLVHDMPSWKWLGIHGAKLELKEDLGAISTFSEATQQWSSIDRTGLKPEVMTFTPNAQNPEPNNDRSVKGVITSIYVLGANDYLLGIMGGGVFRYKNGAFQDLSANLGANLNIFRIGRAPTGYYALTTIKPEGYRYSLGGVFRRESLDSGVWTPVVQRPEIAFPTAIAYTKSQGKGAIFVGSESTPNLIEAYKSDMEEAKKPIDQPFLRTLRDSEGGIWKSEDDGKNWLRVLKGNANDIYVTRIDNREVIFVSLLDQGVQYSSDNGTTWKNLQSFPPSNPRSFSEDSEENGLITVTTFGQGVWRGKVECR